MAPRLRPALIEVPTANLHARLLVGKWKLPQTWSTVWGSLQQGLALKDSGMLRSMLGSPFSIGIPIF